MTPLETNTATIVFEQNSQFGISFFLTNTIDNNTKNRISLENN